MLSVDPRQGSFFDLSQRTKLRLSGADRIRFVNGQITNDVRKATETAAIAACVLNAKGKLNAHIYVSVDGDSIVIDVDGVLREVLQSRLERYLIADDVQIDDITETFALFHVVTASPPSIALAKTVSANRYGLPGFDLWVDVHKAAQVKAALTTAVSFCDDKCAEQFRIEQGVPRWGSELTEDTIPIEANLEESCIDYAKGCYIGQEVISRMKMSGQRNKGLYGLVGKQNEPLVAAMKLWSVTKETKEAGWLTSTTWSDRLGKHIALGYVKRPFNQIGAELHSGTAQGSQIGVKIVDLPIDSTGL